MLKEDLENKFFDINKFPKEPGLLIFPISMSRIFNAQSGKKYFEWLEFFEAKAIRANVGSVFLYTDSLYQKYNQESKNKINKYFDMMLHHKNQFLKNIRRKLYVEKAATFMVWNQSCVNAKGFSNFYYKLLKMYEKDKVFQNYLRKDLKVADKKYNKKNKLFILEEVLISYLITKGQVYLPNEFVQNQEEWILLCYPGAPMKTFSYFHQKNFFKLDNPKNPYQNHFYDLEEKKLYDHTRVTL